MHGLDRIIERFCDAWNRHDVDTLTSLWTEDGELHHPWGTHSVGRAEVREALQSEHAGTMAGSHLTIRSVDARGDEQTLLADLDGLLTEVRAPNGRTYDLDHRLSAMFVRTGEEWQIRTMSPVANPRR
ncbi:MAG TPA: nuclear transport factor 2 family protein [Thermoanaerobaculia bacterium]|jgi:uncharacterized protein (TIGR02246 family)